LPPRTSLLPNSTWPSFTFAIATATICMVNCLCVAHAHVFVGCSNSPPRVSLTVPRVAHMAEEPVVARRPAVPTPKESGEGCPAAWGGSSVWVLAKRVWSTRSTDPTPAPACSLQWFTCFGPLHPPLLWHVYTHKLTTSLLFAAGLSTSHNRLSKGPRPLNRQGVQLHKLIIEFNTVQLNNQF